MAWGYRRSKSFGPLRLTASKSGLGLSVGGPFGRISVNTRGQVRETTRIPGIGLYQTQQIANLGSSGRSRRTSAPHYAAATPASYTPTRAVGTGAKPSARTPIIWLLLMCVFGLALPATLPVDSGGALSLLVGAACALGFLIALIRYILQSQRSSNVALPHAVPGSDPTAALASAGATQFPAVAGQQLSDVVRDALAAPSGGPNVGISVEALDAIGGNLNLNPADANVVTAKLVGLTNTPASVADLIHLQPGEDGLRHGVHDGMLIPTGAEWHAFCLLHPEDDPQASAPHPAKAVALHLGRLGARDARKYEHLFQSHPVIVSLFIETTSGLERIEARFLNEPVQVDDSVGKHEAPTEATASPAARVSTPTSVAPANWYPDPTDQTKWRWWDGQQWTTYTAPRIKTTA